MMSTTDLVWFISVVGLAEPVAAGIIVAIIARYCLPVLCCCCKRGGPDDAQKNEPLAGGETAAVSDQGVELVELVDV